jgi:hypothetical protein
LETMLNFLDDSDFARRFERSAPLCVFHTARLVQTQASHPGLRRLLALQRDKFAHLVGELDEFCRKHDYRFAHEPWGAESDSWLRAIELLVGKPEVLGNEIYRRERGGGVPRGRGVWRDWWRRWLGGETAHAPERSPRAKGGKRHPGRREDQPDSDRKEHP